MSPAEQLSDLAARLDGVEILPGVALAAPKFDASWSEADRSLDGLQLPATFIDFLLRVGAISAMDTAGGIAFLTPDEVRDHLHQAHGHLIRSVDGTPAFPFAVNGSGSYLLLALDDSSVWKYNAHMHPVAKPIRIADGFDSFLGRLVADWEAVLAGRGGPYATS